MNLENSLANRFWYRTDQRLGLQSSHYAREQAYPPLCLGEYVFVYCVEGTLLVRECGDVVALQAGEVLVGNGRSRRSSIYAPDGLPFRGLTVIANDEEFRDALQSLRGIKSARLTGKITAPDLLPLAAMLAARIQDVRPANDLALAGGSQLLLAELLQRWPDPHLVAQDSRAVSTLSRPEYVRTLLLMQTLRKCDFSVGGICRAIGTSPARFYRLFEATTGAAPLAHFNGLLLERASLMLRSSACSVKEVAIELGFNCESHFCKLFRRHFGVSPEDYAHRSGSLAAASF